MSTVVGFPILPWWFGIKRRITSLYLLINNISSEAGHSISFPLTAEGQKYLALVLSLKGDRLRADSCLSRGKWYDGKQFWEDYKKIIPKKTYHHEIKLRNVVSYFSWHLMSQHICRIKHQKHFARQLSPLSVISQLTLFWHLRVGSAVVEEIIQVVMMVEIKLTKTIERRCFLR